MPGYLLGRLFGYSSYRDKTSALMITAQDVMYKVMLVFLSFTAILWMAVFFYATFYYSYMPAISHIRPVHLQFRSCGRDYGLCTFPSANVTLTKKEKLLMVGQPYKVVLEMEMPESEANQRLGMFMVCVSLKDSDAMVVEKSCRSAILHYKSFLHHIITTFVFFPFLLSGSAEEKQLVVVELFSGFQELSGHPVTEAFVEIQSQHVELYHTFLKIHAHFTGLRYFMFNWPFLSAFLGISTIFFFLAIIGFLSWYKFFVPKQVVVHIGYDATAAKSLDERRMLAKQRLIQDQEKRSSFRNEEEPATIRIEEVCEEPDAKSKMEEYEVDYKPVIDADEVKEVETSSESEDKSQDSHLDGSSERKSSDDFELIAKADPDDTEVKTEPIEDYFEASTAMDENEESGLRFRKLTASEDESN